jgi:hypothetical protein
MSDGPITISASNKQLKLVWTDPGNGSTKIARGSMAVIYPVGIVVFHGEQGEIILNNSVQYVIT